MSKAEKLLEQMQRNPLGDWTIADIETVSRQYGATCRQPARGSHYKITHPKCEMILTIPAKRPIKPFYVKQFVSMIVSTIE